MTSAARPNRGAYRGSWEITTTNVYDRWFAALDTDRSQRVSSATKRLAARGPTLGRPRADTITGSRMRHLKELRVGETMRVLFAFDPNRRAVLLVGGDKRGRGNDWYKGMIKTAERLYDDHLRSIGKGDRCPVSPRRQARRTIGR